MRNVYEGAAIRSLYRQLVDDFGGFDAAAAFLKCSKGTLSKQCHGDAAIGPEHFGALEDAVGRWPITRLLFGRLAERGLPVELSQQAQQALREAADLTPAIFSLLIHGDAGPIQKEGPEAMASLADLLRAVDADSTEGKRP
ncbi:hypothetical protein [Sulfitobacter sp. UBA4523]|jgi:hypothetical protein|uniref:hypothetical protein n=1 Tax=Sulfitobacter sp. UBA4523 TaxID=1947584 RepID=UPI000C621505|nr:hypothetical protein [Sulfitobacter sp. UBA4523]MAX76579.1 hypothetical protein [Roseobacter sp.]HBR41796.1 hypothetical protein [Sulfitobacter pontiacus]|tara:strand:- start:30400 stop:30822 length:423 start_codon:yes stop_codon:yes gene_type:complete